MIIVAPDKFKGTYTASQIASVIAGRLRSLYPGEEILEIPMADGGEGTSEILSCNLGLDEVSAICPSPCGEGLNRCIYYRRGEVAAVDSAALTGLAALTPPVSALHPRPMDASSYPLGLLVRQLLDDGVRHIYIGVGGTMTTDGGAGFLQAMGTKFFDSQGREITAPLTPRLLPSAVRVDLSGIRIPDGAVIEGLMDVEVPLLPRTDEPGELSVLSFANQKGVTPEQMPELEETMRHLVEILCPHTPNRFERYPGAGAGGGIGLALWLIGAKCCSGALRLLDMQIPELVEGSCRPAGIREVYTGEGAFDRQSLGGKVTATVIDYARRLRIPVTVVCGRCDLPSERVPKGCNVVTLTSFLDR